MSRFKPSILLRILFSIALFFSSSSLFGNVSSDSSASPDSQLIAKGEELAKEFFGALATRDASEIGPLLAPAFQIVRASGTVHSKEEYIADPPVIGKVSFDNFRVTGNEKELIVSYVVLEEYQTESGSAISRSPRLSTFRLNNERWLLLSHANFGPLR